MGDCMKYSEFAYCNECEDLVEYEIKEEIFTEYYKDVLIKYKFHIGRCKECGEEVATDTEYIYRKTQAKLEAYKEFVGIILLKEIEEILEKYNIGKEALADIAGFGKATIKRYFEGFIPAKEYSDILYQLLDDELFFKESVEKNKYKLKEITYEKIVKRYADLVEIKESKINQIINYILINLDEVTPLALEKILYFCNGVNYAINGKCLFEERCQAWQHGPVYPEVYDKYKKYGYKPIDKGIYSTHGCMQSLLLEEEISVIDIVLQTFGLYSPKTLEKISHMQTPWLEKRVGYDDKEPGNQIIDEKSIQKFYIENNLNSKDNIMNYISRCIDAQFLK